MPKLLFPLLLIISSGLFAQQKVLENYFAQVRMGKYPAIPLELTKPENVQLVLNALPKYLADSVATVRLRATSLARSIGSPSKIIAVRTKAVQQIIAASKDRDTGNAGAALTFVTEFKKNDFSKTDQDTLYAIFKRKSAHLNTLIRLMGYLEIQSSKNDLYNLSQDAGLGRKDRWAAILALARMGDEQAANDILNRIKRMPVGDAVVYEVFPDLIYTRRPEAISYLVEALNSDAKNCESANSDNPERIPCAYRIMEMLAPVIENYPLKQNASGDIETNDYPAALQKVREWLKINKGYKILRDGY
jgi:PBS lyase HEAT-like repeat